MAAADAKEQSRLRVRRSARVFVFDRVTGDVLLIRFEAERNGILFRFWVTPGGEIEAGEEERAAAEREVNEELGLLLELSGPVHREDGGTYVHLGEVVKNEDVFFRASCGRDEPKLAGVTEEEISLMRELRWWSQEELERTTEEIFPRGLGEIVKGLWRDVKERHPLGDGAVCEEK